MVTKYPLPGNPERYKHYQRCKVCGHDECYTLTDGCTLCFQSNLQVDIDNRIKDGRVFPSDVAVATEHGFSWYANVHATPCPKGPHMFAKHVTTGRCVGCTGDKNDPNRAKAKANGEPTYPHSFPCPKCNTDLRKTASNRCVKCNPAKPRERSADQALMEDNPLTLVTYGDALAHGRKVYRTGLRCKRGHKGWRYVSNSACIDCLNGVAESNQEYSEEKRPEEAWMRERGRIKITRNESIQLGYKLYKTARPCKRGHLSFRRVNGGACIDCQKGLRAEEWNDPDEVFMRKHPTKPVSRAMAELGGLRVYRPGDIFGCDHGIGWRYMETGHCVDCTKEGARRAPKHLRK